MVRSVKKPARQASFASACPEIEWREKVKCQNHSSTVTRALEAFLAAQSGLEQTISLLKRDFPEADTEWEDLVMDMAGSPLPHHPTSAIAIEIGKKLIEVRLREAKRDALAVAITSRRPRTKPAPQRKARPRKAK